MTALFRSHRQFKVWKYRISHEQLLLRSVPTASEPRRLEVLFRGVLAMKLTTNLDHLTIQQPSDEELTDIRQQIWNTTHEVTKTAFIVRTLDSTGYVVASDFSTAEDDADYKTPSSLFIDS
jgi:hypothetical protein